MILPSLYAGVAQLVEHFLAKEDVARSSRVTRSLSPEGKSASRANRRNSKNRSIRAMRSQIGRVFGSKMVDRFPSKAFFDPPLGISATADCFRRRQVVYLI